MAVVGEMCLTGRWWVIRSWRSIQRRKFQRSFTCSRLNVTMDFQSSREMTKMSVGLRTFLIVVYFLVLS